MAAGVGTLPPNTEQTPEATVVLQVRVADAQGLRLLRGGEIRLVITLRTIEDPDGGAFGLKVTPWQEVPDNHAPTWRPREAIFSVPAERCFSAEFVDSAHLHIALMQKGHALPPGRSAPGISAAATARGGAQPGGASAAPKAAPPLQRGLGFLQLKPEGFAAALQGAVAAVQGVGVAPPIDKGEVVGTLRLPLGRRLVCPDDSGGMEGAAWVQLIDSVDGGQKVKGSLLLELKTAHNHLTQPSSPPRSAPRSPTGAGVAGTAGPGSATILPAVGLPAPATEVPSKKAEPSTISTVSTEGPAERATGAPAASPTPSVGEVSDSASESGVESDVAASQSSAPTSALVAPPHAAGGCTTVDELPRTERPFFLQSNDFASGDADAPPIGRLASRDNLTVRWLASSKATSDGYVSDGYASDGYVYEGNSDVNIFTINNSSASSSSAADVLGSGAAALGKLLRWGSKPSRQLRTALDLGKGKHRRDSQKWRRWHEVFCVLNEIEQRLTEVVALLMQAAASMRQFGDSHTRLVDCARLSAFLCDAVLYFKSEGEVPKRLEGHLSELERIADEFRRLSVDGSSGGDMVASGSEGVASEADATGAVALGGKSELWLACEDLQVDIAVLLESAQMTAQLALAEYQKMHCRLELLVTEYSPVCRLELDDAQTQRPATFLPLLTDESATQVSAASVPERALEWALDFAQLVGSASQGLEKLVRELDQRTRQLKNCTQELKAETLRRVASGQTES